MADRRIIDDFLAQRRIAVAGVSRNPHKFGNVLFRELKQRGYDVLPLNPTLKEFGIRQRLCLGWQGTWTYLAALKGSI